MNIDINSTLVDIEKMMRAGNFEQAKIELQTLSLDDDFVRKFLVECIIQTEDHALAIKVLSEPKAVDELIVVLNSAIELKNKTLIKHILDSEIVIEVMDASTKNLLKKAKATLNG